jgi:hypothetical protein
MVIEETARGFALAKFVDAAGLQCSLQDSSLASEACIWLGVASIPGIGDCVTRMHLTQDMALQVARALQAALGNGGMAPQGFVDRYGSSCTITFLDEAGGAVVAVGVVRAFEGRGTPMMLSRRNVEALLPRLLGFIAEGTITGHGGASVLEPVEERHLDVVIPPSMLERTDVGQTGVSARELIDAFRRLHERYEDDLESALGHDAASRIEALADRLAPVAQSRPA